MRLAAIGLALFMGVAAAPARAQYVEPNITFFYPLVTRRPIIERELEFKLMHTNGLEERQTEAAVALEWPILPRLQIELEVPFVFRDPDETTSGGGLGDVEVQAKFLLVKSVQYRTLMALGLESKFATGSETRGLGGEYALEPFLTAGVALGPFDVIAEVAYEWLLSGDERPREQEFTARLAIGYPMSRRFTPLFELVTVTETRGPADEEDEAVSLRHKTQVYVVPGFNIRPLPRMTLRVGVQVPVTSAQAFDYRFHSALVVEF